MMLLGDIFKPSEGTTCIFKFINWLLIFIVVCMGVLLLGDLF